MSVLLRVCFVVRYWCARSPQQVKPDILIFLNAAVLAIAIAVITVFSRLDALQRRTLPFHWSMGKKNSTSNFFLRKATLTLSVVVIFLS